MDVDLFVLLLVISTHAPAHTLYFSSDPAAEEKLKEEKNILFQEIHVKTLKRYFNSISLAQKETRLFGGNIFLHCLKIVSEQST